RELREQVSFFVRSAIRSDDADRGPTVLVAHFGKLLPDQFERIFPTSRSQFPVLPDQRLRQPFFMIREVKPIPPLDAEKVSVRAALVTVIAAHNLQPGVGAPHTQRRLASIAAMCAHGADVLHLPGTRLVAISSRSECTHWT